MAKSNLNAFAKTWIKALKSGKYKRTTGSLTNNRGAYCCLGVACAIQKKVKDWKEENTLEGSAWPVGKRLGLRTAEGDFQLGAFSRYPNASSLVDLNDDYGVPFSEIADFIKTEPRGLFYDDDSDYEDYTD